MSTYLVTGGAGFIGSAVVRNLILNTDNQVINLDKLTYAGNLDCLSQIESNPRYQFHHGDITDEKTVSSIIQKHRPDIIMHLAAETHVDRSIHGPSDFIQTNIVGTFTLLDAALEYWAGLDAYKKDKFRFHHVSTDEVFGTLGEEGLFVESSPYEPNSPYSASKASSDHLVRAWNKTYGLPVLITNCSNNYGPYQFPEKLIPLVIMNALNGKFIPVYGNGLQVRDWLYVEDHANALLTVASKGRVGETYNIGGHNELTNISLVQATCDILDKLVPNQKKGFSYRDLIRFVDDRPGHDLRYAIDASKIKNELGWEPYETFDTGLKKTVEWYISNKKWYNEVLEAENSPKELSLGFEQTGE